jgi:hypothetical protein
MSNNRQIVGSIVHSKSIHVTNKAECGHHYAQNKLTKLVVHGHVAEVQNGQSRTGCSQCFLIFDFHFGGSVLKRKKLNIRTIKLVPPPVAAKFPYSAQNPQNSKIKTVDAVEAGVANLNGAGIATIKQNVLAAPAALPAPPNTTYDGSLSLRNLQLLAQLQRSLPLEQPTQPFAQHHHSQHQPCQCFKTMARNCTNRKTPNYIWDQMGIYGTSNKETFMCKKCFTAICCKYIPP